MSFIHVYRCKANVMYSIFYRNWALGRAWSNLSATEQHTFLEEALGPQHKYSDDKVVIPTIVYSAISIFGIPGNIITCLTIISNSYLRTAPNFFIFNLAVVDLIILILGNMAKN